MRRWIRNLRGENVVFTGEVWLRRADVWKQVRRRGAIAESRISLITTILVKGESERWKYGDHGTKERKAAQFIRDGVPISLIHESEFRNLLEKGIPARVADRVAGEPIEWLTPATYGQFEQAARKRGPLDREHSVLGRVEQGYLRRILFGKAEYAKCSLCARRLPVELLVAAHLKMRSECTRRERLDARNIVASMCLLGCDVLYEQGLVTVGEDGRILTSAVQPCPALIAIFRDLRKRKCRAWNEGRAKYFKWHLTQRFQGAATAI